MVLTRPSHGCMHFEQISFFYDFTFYYAHLEKVFYFEKFVQDCNKLLNMDMGKFVGS
jgi:hypothetical protein